MMENFDPDAGKDPTYIRNRNSFLKRSNWNDEDALLPKRGRKPKSPPRPQLDLTKQRNKKLIETIFKGTISESNT